MRGEGQRGIPCEAAHSRGFTSDGRGSGLSVRREGPSTLAGLRVKRREFTLHITTGVLVCQVVTDKPFWRKGIAGTRDKEKGDRAGGGRSRCHKGKGPVWGR